MQSSVHAACHMHCRLQFLTCRNSCYFRAPKLLKMRLITRMPGQKRSTRQTPNITPWVDQCRNMRTNKRTNDRTNDKRWRGNMNEQLSEQRNERPIERICWGILKESGTCTHPLKRRSGIGSFCRILALSWLSLPLWSVPSGSSENNGKLLRCYNRSFWFRSTLKEMREGILYIFPRCCKGYLATLECFQLKGVKNLWRGL